MDESRKHAKLDRALEARDEFLKEHSELLTFQEEIDQILGQVGGTDERMRILALEMEKKLIELNRLAIQLHAILELTFKALLQEARPTLH